jgi:bacterioferritin
MCFELEEQIVQEKNMEQNKNVIDGLNKALSLEWAGCIQYLQHSFLVHGLHREVYKPFFTTRSAECRDHAALLGEKIAALGGLPTVEPAPIKQGWEIEEMLQQDLELEKAAVTAYLDALKMAKEDAALRHMLESLIETETTSVEDIEKLLSMNTIMAGEKEIRLKKMA